jgi:hypothetical protein
MEKIIENKIARGLIFNTVFELLDAKHIISQNDIGKYAFASIKRTVKTDKSNKHKAIEQEIHLTDKQAAENLYVVLGEVVGGWNVNDGKVLPDNEVFVFVKKDGKIFNEAVYRVEEDWFLWNGQKLAKTFAKQFHHWKYQHLFS